MHVIAIAGQARAGKTTFANMMAQALFEAGYTPSIQPFAQPIREALRTLGVSKETHPQLYRKMAQLIGTDMLRNPDFMPDEGTGGDWWLNHMDKRLQVLLADEARRLDEGATQPWPFRETVVLVDDIRFPNELELLEEAWDAVTIFVTRNDLPDPKGTWRNHESEIMAREFDENAELRDEAFDLIVGPDLSLEELESIVNHTAETVATNALTGYLTAMREDEDD
jgi:hypothetical protein